LHPICCELLTPKKFEVAVLITNDSDLAEPVRIVAQELGLPVGILNPH
jgi:hypothetical protein